MHSKTLRNLLAAAAVALFALAAHSADFSLYLWVELIGFDNTRPDLGVGEYLSRMPAKPDCVTLLLHNESLFREYKGLENDFPLHFTMCSYRGRPHNPERKRQDWTAWQLRKLVEELHANNVKVLASFFCWDVFPVDDAYIDKMASLLVPFLKDFGFDGFHAADGYAPPFYLLPECPDADRPAIARRTARRYAENFRRLVAALKPAGLECWVNSCFIRDPYEAMFRYGVDYRLLAKTGITGIFVESSGAAQSLLWSFSREGADPIDKCQAMLLRLKASVGDVPCVLLHGINDGAEEWSALRHAPAHVATEALALSSVFHDGKRALAGFLACLADGISPREWSELFKTWTLAFTPVAGPEGVNVVWSDRAFDAEFDACASSRDASSYTLLYELISRGAVVNSSISVERAMADASLPILLLNPEFFPEDELARLRARPSRVIEIGRGARPPNSAEYVRLRPDELKVPGMPSNAGWNVAANFAKNIPEHMPPKFIFDRVANTIKSYTAPFEVLTPDIRACAFRLQNGRLGIMARSEHPIYTMAQFAIRDRCSDVLVHTAFPAMPMRTILEGKIAPQETMFLSVGDKEDIGPNRPPEQAAK